MSAGRLRTLTRAVAAALVLTVLVPVPAWPVAVDPPLADPVQEQRAIAISRGLRCLVCQNQSIEDSNADLARDLRRIVRERIQAGDTDDQVRAYLVDRYGDWVLLRPPFKAETWALWLAPVVVLVLAGLLVRSVYRRPTEADAPKPLSDEERARLAALTDDPTP
jgi:cytochrome c-type biogenesis protein CcmH